MKRFFAVSLLMLLLFLLLPSGPALAGRSFQIDWAESLGNGYVVANFSDSAKSSQYFGRYLRKERSYSDTIYEAMVPAFDGSKILAHMDSDMSFKLQFDLNLYDTRISSDDVIQIFLYTPNGWERPLVSCSYYMFSNSYHRCCIGGSFDEMEYVLGEAVPGTYTVVMYWNGKLVGSNSFQVN